MRRIYASEYWPGREDEKVDDVFFNETPRLPNGLCDQFFVSDIPRVRWIMAYRAARLTMRARMWRDLSDEAANRITSAVGHAIGWSRGGYGDATDAQFDLLVTAAYIAIGEYHWLGSDIWAGMARLPVRPPLPPLGTALNPRPTTYTEPMLMAAE